MRVALYARVSTDEQTVAPQLDALRDYARARGLEVVEEFIDHGVSGWKDRRPGRRGGSVVNDPVTLATVAFVIPG